MYLFSCTDLLEVPAIFVQPDHEHVYVGAYTHLDQMLTATYVAIEQIIIDCRTASGMNPVGRCM